MYVCISLKKIWYFFSTWWLRKSKQNWLLQNNFKKINSYKLYRTDRNCMSVGIWVQNHVCRVLAWFSKKHRDKILKMDRETLKWMENKFQERTNKVKQKHFFMIIWLRELRLAVKKLKLLHIWRELQSEVFGWLMQKQNMSIGNKDGWSFY